MCEGLGRARVLQLPPSLPHTRILLLHGDPYPSTHAPCAPPSPRALLQRVVPEAVRSLRQVMLDIVAKEGAAGLFKGALPSIFKAAPSAAVTFATYDFFLRCLTLSSQQQQQQQQREGASSAQPSGMSAAARRPLH